jgi:phage repressor protein C with HTH and peptisase S24 domain
MDSETLGQVVRRLRIDKGISLREMGDRVGIHFASFGAKERGEGKGFTYDQRRSIARALGMSMESFEAAWRGTTIKQARGPGIPVINRAPAGDVVDYEEYGTDSGQGYEYLDTLGVPDDDLAFAVVVVGDSMEPNLRAGDYAIFSPLNVPRPRRTLENGKVVFVRFSDDGARRGCTIARWFFTGERTGRLVKDNPKYAPIDVELTPESVARIAILIQRRTESV